MPRVSQELCVAFVLVVSLLGCKVESSESEKSEQRRADSGVEPDASSTDSEAGSGGKSGQGGSTGATAGKGGSTGATLGKGGASGARAGQDGGGAGGRQGPEPEGGTGGTNVAGGSGESLVRREGAGGANKSGADIVKTATDLEIVKVSTKPAEQIVAAPGPCQEPQFFDALLAAAGDEGGDALGGVGEALG